MKKIVSMLLIIAMLLSMCAVSLTGCTREKTAEEIEEDLKKEQANAASTLVMWVVTEEGTDPEQAEAVADAMALITKSKYKTDLVIRYLTMDEYYEKLEAAILETERLAALKALGDETAKATKKADGDVTGDFKNGKITEEEKDDKFFTYVVDAIKVINSVVTGTSTDEDYEGVVVSDEELEEMLIEIVGQLVQYDMADAFLADREALLATLESELANPPSASEVKKSYIFLTQEAVDMVKRLFDLIEEHKAEFEALLEEEEEEDEEEKDEEKKDEDTLIRDEQGNMVVDTTVYPEVTDNQVDIIYMSGFDKYTEYVENEWIAALDSELSGSSKVISSYVSTSLLNAVKLEGATYAIPNNNIIGEFTYMLIDKQLFDKYYYTGTVENVHGVADIADFIQDVANYEPDVLPINGNLDYCLSLIAHYWSINPETLAVNPAQFSVVGHAYAPGSVITRGSTALTFSNLLADENYVKSLINLKTYDYAGYFGTPAEGQKSAVSFVKGDASLVEDYEDDYYVVVVDYPKAADQDIYENMFSVCTYTSNMARSMQVLTLLNTDVEFRNLFQYGIEGINYTLNENNTVKTTSANAYHMDLAKTGNEFIAYVPEGMNAEVWEYAKTQNRQSQVDPLLGFDLVSELSVEAEEEFNSEEASSADAQGDVFYYIEAVDKDLLKYVDETSKKVWDELQACEKIEDLEKAIKTWEKKLSTDEKIKSAMTYEVIEPELDKTTGEVVPPDPEDFMAKKPTIKTTITKTLTREIPIEITAGESTEEGTTEEAPEGGAEGTPEGTEPEAPAAPEVLITKESYFLITKTYTPYQIYYRWMQAYGYVPADFAAPAPMV